MTTLSAPTRPTRPILPAHARLQALGALRSVSLALPFSGNDPLALLAHLRPDVHVKGGSFEEARVRQERALVEGWGGRLAFVPLVAGHSTSRLVAALSKTGG
jgi:bifunctional ADP-heptose synthase (sugar kinase/adenylyltransferase)